MPKTTPGGKVKQSELPSTLKKSDTKAQKTYAEAHDAALKEYGEESRAYRVAFAALKRTHEKVGDHWEPKEKNGPSDARAATGGLDNPRKSAGGVDANASKEHLLGLARRLDIKGRSKMSKDELVEALERENNRRTSANRSSS
jgi:cation transport regulator ChaB